MLRLDTPVQLQDPRITDRREFVTGRVTQTGTDTFVGDFIVSKLTIDPDADLVVYYESKRKFMQQSVRAASVEVIEGGLRLELELVGDPVAAEGREVYRVPCSGSELSAVLDGEAGCPLLDVSSLGFAVNAHGEFAIGDVVPVSIDWEGETYAGDASIQSVRVRGRGRTRYGLRFLKDDGNGSLREGLRKISLAIEREHLRNISGS